MIEHSDVDQAQCIAEAVGDELVGLAGFDDAGGVIVGLEDGGGLVLQGFDDDFAGLDAGAVYRAAEEMILLIVFLRRSAGGIAR